MNNYRSSFFSNIPVVVKNLIAINFIMWLATLVLPQISGRWGGNIDLTDFLGMHYWAADKFNLAQLITYMFMHGGFGHLFFNMFALYMFGGVLENYWGPKKFLIYYLVTGIGAGIVQQLFWTVEYHSALTAINNAIQNQSGEYLIPYQHVYEKFLRFGSLTDFTVSDTLKLKSLFLNAPVTIGASGSVFGLLLAFGWMFPEARLMMLFFPVPIRARIFVIIYGVAELFLGVASFSGDSVAHFAHLGGMLFGVIMILFWKKKKI